MSQNNQKEVVFLPYKASIWKSLEPAWKAACADPEWNVHVIPIPYYYRNLDGSLRDMQYQGEQFPEYVTVEDYNCYDFENRHPDVIFIHNPYDDCNLTTSVHPFFYSKNLLRYTEKLVYIPYFVIDEIEPDDMRAIYNMKYYVSMPGVVHADKVLVQSEKMQLAYIDYLTEFAGEDTRSVWTEKIGVSPFSQETDNNK